MGWQVQRSWGWNNLGFFFFEAEIDQCSWSVATKMSEGKSSMRATAYCHPTPQLSINKVHEPLYSSGINVTFVRPPLSCCNTTQVALQILAENNSKIKACYPPPHYIAVYHQKSKPTRTCTVTETFRPCYKLDCVPPRPPKRDMVEY